MSITSIEIKARTEHPQRIIDYLKLSGAKDLGTDHQLDIYFEAKTGRVKVRKGQVENSLIHYHRPDQSGPKQSTVDLHTLDKWESGAVALALSETRRVLVQVEKVRRILFLDNVKFHVDQVVGLGSFVEIEALGEEKDIPKLEEQCATYVKTLRIQPADLLTHSYSDMLMALRSSP